METRAIMAVYELRAINRKYSIQYIFLFQNYRNRCDFDPYTRHTFLKTRFMLAEMCYKHNLNKYFIRIEQNNV